MSRVAPQTSRADPWAVASNAMAELRRSGDATQRVLIARAMGALGLRELVEAWTATIPATKELAPVITKIREALPTLGPSELRVEERIQNARAALTASKDLARQLGPRFEAWSARQGDRRWFRAKDGNLVCIDPTKDIDEPGAFLRFGDERGRAARRQLPPNKSVGGGPPSPVIVEGVASAAALRDLFDRYPRLPNGSWAALHVIEPEPDALLDALAGNDFSEFVAQDRTYFHVGSDAVERLLVLLREREDDWSKFNCLADTPAGASSDLQGRLDGMVRARGDAYREARAANQAVYAGRDAAWWAERFRRASAGEDEPLRALIVTTRFSTFIRHSSADIRDAFEKLGVRARLLIETDDCSCRDGLAMARAFGDFQPDFVVIINYTRSHVARCMPRQVPHVCWIQDAMPHLFTPDAGADVDPLTIVVGSVFAQLCKQYRYPDNRCLRFGVPASSAKFRAEIRDNPAHDLLVVTNHGETPREMAERLDNECVASGGPKGLLNAMGEQLAGRLDTWDSGFLDDWIRRTIRPVLEHFNINPMGDNAGSLHQQAARPLVDRLLRHRTIGWAADLAERRGARLVVAGKGWEGHPRLGKYSIGQIEHGAALRELYSNAALTLHVSAAWIFHQRLHECLLAGSMPAMLFRPEDVAGAFRPAREQARLSMLPTCSLLDDRRLHVGPWDDPIVATSLSVAQRLASRLTGSRAQTGECEVWDDAMRALETGLIPWRNGRDVEVLPDIRELDTTWDQVRFIDALSESFFRTPDELDALLTRAKEDPGWRRARVEHARKLVEAAFTYERAAEGIVGFLGESIARSARVTPIAS